WSRQESLPVDVEFWRTTLTESTHLSSGEKQPMGFVAGWSQLHGGPDTIMLWGLGGECFRRIWSEQERAKWLMPAQTPADRLRRYRLDGRPHVIAALAPTLRTSIEPCADEILAASFARFDPLPTSLRLDHMYTYERVRRWGSAMLMSASGRAVFDTPLLGNA